MAGDVTYLADFSSFPPVGALKDRGLVGGWDKAVSSVAHHCLEQILFLASDSLFP